MNRKIVSNCQKIYFFCAFLHYSLAHSVNFYPNMMMLSVGPSWIKSNQSATLYLGEPSFPNFYNNQTSTQCIGQGELFIGKRFLWQNHLNTQWGLILNRLENVKIKGRIWQFGSEEYDNLSYHYQISQFLLGFRNKWIFEKQYFNIGLNPFLTTSLSVNFNQSFSYRNWPDTNEIVSNPDFQNKHLRTFAYSIGCGIQKQLNTHFSSGIAYEFYNLGKNQLDGAPDQISRNRLGMSHLYLHAFIFNISIFLDE